MLIEYHLNGKPTGIIEQDNTENHARATKWCEAYVQLFIKADVKITAEPVKRKLLHD